MVKPTKYVESFVAMKMLTSPLQYIQSGECVTAPIIVNNNGKYEIYTSNEFDFIDGTFYIKDGPRSSRIVNNVYGFVALVEGKEMIVKPSQWLKMIENHNYNLSLTVKLVEYNGSSPFIQMIPSVEKDKIKSLKEDDIVKIVLISIKNKLTEPDKIREVIKIVSTAS